MKNIPAFVVVVGICLLSVFLNTGIAFGSPPGAFSKLSPFDGATDLPKDLTLSWEGSDGADAYFYCLDAQCVDSPYTFTTAKSVDLIDLSTGQHSWNVYAYNPDGWTFSNDETKWTFNVTAKAPIFDYGPLSGTYGNTWINDQMSWNFAERFSFLTDTTITRVDIFTGFNSPGSFVHIKILSDAGGIPGSYLYEEDQVPISWTLDPGGVYRVACSLSNPFVAQASTIYWIGVAGSNYVNIGQASVQTPGDGFMAVFNGHSFAYSTDVGDMMFQLYGSSSFSDVPPELWAYDYIMAIYDAAIATGYPDGTYKPVEDVNRAQMAAFIIRALFGEDFSYDLTPHFSDVSSGHWAFKYIQKMFEAGISTGYGDGTYRPVNIVNRAEMAVFVIRALHGDVFTYDSTPHFTDVTNTHWAFKYIQKMFEEGISTGYVDGTYGPSLTVNRASMAAFLARAFLGMP